MNYVYVDNYRGFSKTLVPIQSVNFLVGENSTGKTSMLGLLKLLSPHQFWLSRELDIRQVGFATFADVVSVSANDKSYFSVGLLYDVPEEAPSRARSSGKKSDAKTEPRMTAFVITFREREGVPVLDSFMSYRKGLEVRAKYAGKYIRYTSRQVEHRCSAAEFANSDFLNWARSTPVEDAGYSVLKEPGMFMRNAPPIVALAYIEEEISGGVPRRDQLHLEIRSFFRDMAWLAPIRSKPKKTYDEFSLEFSPEGEHTPYLIKKKLDSRTESVKFRKFIRDVGRDSGLFKDVRIKSYGRTKNSPFQLDIILSEEGLSVSNVGYGISQALPVIVEIFSRPRGAWFAIQQPEVHVHPRAQAALGTIVFNLASLEKKKFLVETHSDFMIDRFRIALRNSKQYVDSQVLFFERTAGGNRVTAIPIGQDGQLSDTQPKAYREFFLHEELALLGL